MRTPFAAVVAAFIVLTGSLTGIVPVAAAASPGRSAASPAARCERLTRPALKNLALKNPALKNTVITDATVVLASSTLPATCQVHARVTHPPAGDSVNIDVWM